MRLGVCTGGGDCPGLNAAIRSIVKHAKNSHGVDSIGVMDSFNGLLEDPPKIRELKIDDVTDILNTGGTILGTYNRGNVYKKENGEEYIKKTFSGFKKSNLDALIVIGGEGTQGMSKILVERGLPIIAIPKTIDNDLPNTNQTIGFDSCVAFVGDSLERLRSTAESHDRIIVCEVMGRDSGFIALHGGVAGGANAILLPEIPYDLDKVIKKINERKKIGRNFSLVVVSEGAYPVGDQQLYKGQNTGVQNLGGIGEKVAKELYQLTNHETRFTVLGHLQRGGGPVATDKILATRLGFHAVEAAINKRFGKLIVVQKGQIVETDFKNLPDGRRKIAMDDDLLLAAEGLGINLGR